MWPVVWSFFCRSWAADRMLMLFALGLAEKVSASAIVVKRFKDRVDFYSVCLCAECCDAIGYSKVYYSLSMWGSSTILLEKSKCIRICIINIYMACT